MTKKANQNSMTLKGSVLKVVGVADNADDGMELVFPMRLKKTKGGKLNAGSGRCYFTGPNGQPFYATVYIGRGGAPVADGEEL